MDDDAVRRLLRTRVDQLGGARRYAETIGVSRQAIYQTLCGNRPPGGKILDDLGLERVISYRHKK